MKISPVAIPLIALLPLLVMQSCRRQEERQVRQYYFGLIHSQMDAINRDEANLVRTTPFPGWPGRKK